MIGLLLGLGTTLKAQTYLLNSSTTNQTYNTCSGNFYDSGGVNGDYANNQNFTITFCSSSSDPITISFDYLDIENNFDELFVYNGPGVGSPQFAGSPYTGFSAPTFTSAPGGCITFEFTSDFSVTYPGWSASISCGEGSDNYNNPGGNISTCSGSFFDTGGPNGAYGNNQNITTTFCSDTDGECINFNFSSFNIENNWDYLTVYDGPSTASPVLGTYTGTNSPGNISGSGSCLTFNFTSDGSITNPGWNAAISCSECDADPPDDGSPPGCPSIDADIAAGMDQELDCATPCTQLEAEVMESGLTTSYEVSSVPYEPPYPFTGGNPLFIGVDDIYSGIINLPFNFCFYGNMYNQAVVGANGIVSFNTGYANQFCPWNFNQNVPNAALPLNAIFGAYHDIDPGQGGEINYAVLGQAPCRTFVVNFNEIPHFQCNCSFLSSCRTTTQQIVIYETTNIIDVYIEQKETCNGWNNGNAVIGIQDATGANGITPPGRNTGPWTANIEAWRFTPNGPPNYVINWYDDQNTLIGTGPTVEVCPQETTNYTGEVIYEHCDGTTVIELDDVTVEVADSFTLDETIIDESCPGACDGSIEVTTIDGLAPFSFELDGGPQQDSGTFSDLCAGDYSITVTDANDCVAVLPFTIDTPEVPDPGESSSIELCENDPGTLLIDILNGTPDAGGQWTDPQGNNHSGNLNPAIDIPGDYTYTVGFPGCEFSAVVSVTIHPTYETILDVSICEGESVTLPDGTNVNTTGSYDVTLQSVITGCDSTITTNVTVNPLLTSEQDFTICEGESVVLPDGTEVNTSGSYNVTLQSVITGCDSTVTTNIIVNPLLTSEQDFTICEDETVTLPDGTQVSTSGSYEVTLQSVVTGCDSTITTNVTVNPLLTSEQDFILCEGETVTLPDGAEVSTTGSYDVTLQSVITGCDSTITTNVTVNPLLASEQDFTICEDEIVTLPDGTDVNTSGSYDVTLQSIVTGCDSTITTNVMVNPLLTSVQDFTICEDETVTLPDGTEVSTTGSYDVTLQSVITGCDSTITTNVTVSPLLNSVQDFTICEGESVTLPDGTEVNTAGSYDVTLQSVVTGCDSTITTNIIVNPLLTSEQDFTICEDETVTLPDGTDVNTGGSYDVTVQSVVTGCDSTITTNVTVNPLLTSEQDFTICEDESVTLPDGTEVNTTGSYDITLQSVITGCDSTITTNVTVNPVLTSEQDFTVCEGGSITLPDGTEVNTGGSYDVTLQSVVTGCDSTITTNVIVNPLLTSEQNFTICEDETVTLPDGTEVNTAGSYDVTLQSIVTGCDSTITTNVTVNPLLTSEQDFTICEDESVALPDGTEVNTAGSYDVILQSVVTGCDSTITTNVSVNPLLTSEQDFTICEGEAITLPDGTEVNTTGSYDVTLQSVVTGCDSTITTNVTVNPLLTSTQDFAICEGESVTLPDGTDINTSGSYDVILSSVITGCDSTITTNVTVNPLLYSEQDITICADESVTLPDGTTVSSAGDYDVTLQSVITGCDSTIATHLSVVDLIDVQNIDEECNTTGSAYTISFEISGGDADSYSVTGIQGTFTPGQPTLFVSDPITSGTAYNISVNDVNACNTVNLSGMVACDCPVSANISGNQTICLGSTAELSFEIEGDGPFDIVYTDGNDNFTINGIDDGHVVSVNPSSTTTYTLVSVQNSLCPGTVSGSAEIEVAEPVNAGDDASLTVCMNEDPQPLIDILDGTPNAGGTWTNPDGDVFNGILDPSVHPGGIYTYTVLGGVCPDATAQVDVTLNDLPHAEILGNASICDGNLANLEVELEGSGSWTIIYAINGIEQPPVVTSDPEVEIETGEEGLYTIISVEDEFCTGTGSGNGSVSINESPTANISGQGAICPGGEAELDIDLEGEGPWTVLYSIDGVEQDPLIITDNEYLLLTSDPGLYEIISVNDANCPGTPSGSAEVEYLPYPEATVSGGGTICPGDSALVEIELEGQGDIVVEYTDGNGNQTIIVQSGSFTFYTNTPGTYELLSVSDEFCTGTVDGVAEVIAVDLPTAAISGGGVICDGESTPVLINFYGEAPFDLTYSIDDVEQDLQTDADSVILDVDEPGTYELIGVSDAACSNSATGTVSISVNELPTGVMSGGGVICAGENEEIQIDFTGSGNWEFVMTHNGEADPAISTNISPYIINTDDEGVYELISVIDDNCPGIAEGDAEIDVNDLPTATISGDGAICDGQAANLLLELTGAGPWTVGYTINGDQQPPLVVNDSPFDLTTQAPGDYTLLSVADQHCIGTVDGTASVTEFPLPTAHISGNAVLCPTVDAVFNIVLTGSAPWTVVYSIDGVDQPPLEIDSSPFELLANAEGNYQIESVQDLHCGNTGTGTAVLEYASFPTATLSGGGTFCPGEMGNVAIIFTGDGPWTFEYAIDGVVYGPITTSSNTYTLFDDITGTYSLVSVSDALCGGTVEGEANVVFNETPQVAISPGGSVCPGESYDLWTQGSGGLPPYTYQWFNTQNDSWVQFDDSVNFVVNGTSGIYVVVTDQCGSTAFSDTSWVSPHIVPLASFHFDPRHDLTVQYTTINYTSETSLHAYSLYWEFYELSDYYGWQQIGTSYENNPTFTYPNDKPGVYQACLYVTTEEGCVNEVCIPLEIAGEFIFYMPNAFTPNEDGINDLFGPVMEGIDPDSFEFLIVNRWGETVFYTNDIDQKWNGSGMDGTHYAPDGVYNWRVKVRQLNASDAEEYRGNVNLLR